MDRFTQRRIISRGATSAQVALQLDLELNPDCRTLDTAPCKLTIMRMAPTLNSRLTTITLPDTDGREVRLGSLWLHQPAVVVFLRHYG